MSDFVTSGWVDRLGGHISRNQNFWIKLGNLETKILRDELEDTSIEAPIYVSGLARAGSTILLELLDAHPDTVTHRYKDYPPVFTPYWWNRFLDFMPKKDSPPAERAHKDGIVITPESPEAFEEVIWMAFFPHLHDPRRNAQLDRTISNPAFEDFYREHIKKLLKVRGGRRYLSKGNYNLTRLAYLQKLHQDARFIVPLRHPAWHVASLIKQHRLFCKGEEGNPKALAHMQRVGHFEFGLDRRPINAGDNEEVEQILEAWRQGREVEGTARYWAHLHRHLARQLEDDATLQEALLVVHYDELCEKPAAVIERLFDHARLTLPAELKQDLIARVAHPNYYQPDFTAEERRLIDRLTEETAAAFDRYRLS